MLDWGTPCGAHDIASCNLPIYLIGELPLMMAGHNYYYYYYYYLVLCIYFSLQFRRLVYTDKYPIYFKFLVTFQCLIS